MGTSKDRVTISREQFEAMAAAVDIVTTMAAAAKAQAKQHPTKSGVYPATVLMTADGKVVIARDASDPNDPGLPVVCFPPLSVEAVTPTGVEFRHPLQHVSPHTAAALADVHVATIWRAVKEGDLPKPTKLSSRRVGFPLGAVETWMAGRE